MQKFLDAHRGFGSAEREKIQRFANRYNTSLLNDSAALRIIDSFK